MTSPARRVLVADDDEDLRDLVTLKLETAGIEVRTAEDGAAALDLLREWRPDLAILDVMMPGTSGLSVLREVRGDEDPGVAGTTVMLLTARARDEDVDAGSAAGADAYMSKPFSPRELLARVAELLGGT